MPDFLSPHRIALIGHAQGAEAQKTVQKFTEISLPSMLFSIIYLVSTCKPDFKDLSGTFSTVIQKGCQVRASTTTTIVAPIQIFKQDIYHFLAAHLSSSCFFNLSRVAPLPPLSALNGGCMQDVRPPAQVNTSKYYALCTKHYALMHYAGCQVMSTS